MATRLEPGQAVQYGLTTWRDELTPWAAALVLEFCEDDQPLLRVFTRRDTFVIRAHGRWVDPLAPPAGCWRSVPVSPMRDV